MTAVVGTVGAGPLVITVTSSIFVDRDRMCHCEKKPLYLWKSMNGEDSLRFQVLSSRLSINLTGRGYHISDKRISIFSRAIQKNPIALSEMIRGETKRYPHDGYLRFVRRKTCIFTAFYSLYFIQNKNAGTFHLGKEGITVPGTVATIPQHTCLTTSSSGSLFAYQSFLVWRCVAPSSKPPSWLNDWLWFYSIYRQHRSTLQDG